MDTRPMTDEALATYVRSKGQEPAKGRKELEAQANALRIDAAPDKALPKALEGGKDFSKMPDGDIEDYIRGFGTTPETRYGRPELIAHAQRLERRKAEGVNPTRPEPQPAPSPPARKDMDVDQAGHATHSAPGLGEKADDQKTKSHAPDPDQKAALDDQKAQGQKAPGPGRPPLAGSVASAVRQLNDANDDHWTPDGKPSVKAVGELVGHPVTRQEVDAASSRTRKV